MKVLTQTNPPATVEAQHLVQAWINHWDANGFDPVVLNDVSREDYPKPRKPGEWFTVPPDVFPRPTFEPPKATTKIAWTPCRAPGWEHAPLVQFAGLSAKRINALLNYGSDPLMLVMAFYDGDAAAFEKTIKWMGELQPHYDRHILLCFQRDTRPVLIQTVRAAAEACFEKAHIHLTAYKPPGPKLWPPSVAFAHAADIMARHFNAPWLWCEFDMIPLKAGWVDTMEAEYRKAAMPFMGVVIPDKGWVNGTAIYPRQTPALLADALAKVASVSDAWDCAAKDEMAGLTHDCPHLLQHVWGLHAGKFHPYLGESPRFDDPAELQQISPTAVLYHRNKNGKLIDWLRKSKTP